MATADRFGASVSMTLPGRGLFLIVGRSGTLDQAVASAGGTITVRLSAERVIAVMAIATYQSLRRLPQIRFIGPITVDQQRLAATLAHFQLPPAASPASQPTAPRSTP